MIFFDAETLASSINIPTIVENSVSTIQLSGITYYTTGSTFTIEISDIDNLNAESYPLNQVTVQAPEFGLSNLNIPGSDLTGWDSS